MTSDAKIGLLLGLVFIFIIAFIINGLPSFTHDSNNNKLTTDMVDAQNSPAGLAAKERKIRREIINQIESTNKQPLRQVPTASTTNQDVRFVTALPTSKPPVREAEESPVSPEPSKLYGNGIASKQPALQEVYIVNEGDNLALIAQKVYGAEEGNKTANINRIFNANRKLLKSPDEIYIGQKLIIPLLSAPPKEQNKMVRVFSKAIFTKVESIGKRHSLTTGRESTPAREHIVREGESLWQIAAERLGDGNRYGEIVRLNSDILDDEDSLAVEMRLKLPVR